MSLRGTVTFSCLVLGRPHVVGNVCLITDEPLLRKKMGVSTTVF